MKFILVLIVALSSDFAGNKYAKILEDLENNSTLLVKEMGKTSYLEVFHINETIHSTRVKSYKRGINAFYNADIDIINYLLKYEFDTLNICTWIRTVNPLQSKLHPKDLISRSKGALILIDNYLRDYKTEIRISDDMPILEYTDLKEFLKEKKHCDKWKLRREYIPWLSKIKKLKAV